MSAAQRLAIVGNGPVADGLAEQIDASDMVIRFNEPAGGPDRIGIRTDILFLMNSGKSMQARLSTPDFWRSPYFAGASRVILPYHPSIIAKYHPRPNILSRLKGRKADWTAETLEMCGKAGKQAIVLPPEFYEESCEALGIAPAARNRVFPSSGFLGIRYALLELATPPEDIALYGFSWQGWKRHDWGAERAWSEAHLGRKTNRAC
ncbi:MAG: glycosyltransferase family 29 protein [Pseudaminobacter sp.]|nr:glycosyltransferase family 29 protein [Pseudaminobacter sp.]